MSQVGVQRGVVVRIFALRPPLRLPGWQHRLDILWQRADPGVVLDLARSRSLFLLAPGVGCAQTIQVFAEGSGVRCLVARLPVRLPLGERPLSRLRQLGQELPATLCDRLLVGRPRVRCAQASQVGAEGGNVRLGLTP